MARGFDIRKLNAAQREAVVTTDGPVLILAGAGTGKTRTITARIAHMVETGITPESILAVTFTNKAANEMRERVAGMVPRGAAGKLTLCTFHSLCVRLLRRSIDRLGYKRNFSIYTGSDQTGLIRRIIVRKGGKDEKLEPGAVIARISTAKNRNLPVEADGDELLASIARAYEEEKRTLNAVDFDDLLVLAVRLLGDHEEVRAHWRNRFRYIMVDEFQDTNRLQMDLLRHLVGAQHNVCVVGDDDQSIYGWRGAEVENILAFERFFPDPAVIRLEENYRSTTAILETANSLIRHNVRRREKKLWTRAEEAERIRLVAMPGDAEEAQWVVEEIADEVVTQERRHEDYAVLIRTNQQSRLFEEALRERRIPYRMIGGQSFFDRREVKDVLAYLTVLVHPEDDVNLLRILNTPPRGISKATAEKAIAASREMDRPVWTALRSAAFLESLGARVAAAVQEFVASVERWTEAARGDYGAAAAALLEEVDYDDFVRRGCKTPEEVAMRAESVASLVGDLKRHRQEHADDGLRGFLDGVALDDTREDDKDNLEAKKGVSLITLHAAKGLEFPCVYLVGLEEGILPHRRALEEDARGRDEERRLLYVGITRAMRRLTLTYCALRKKWGEKVACRPSSFLGELDAKWIDEISWDEVMAEPSTDEDRERDLAFFKAMLEAKEG